MQNFNWVDYIIIAIFAFSILAGFARGFVKEVLSLLTLIAAVVIAAMFANPLAAHFTSAPAVQGAMTQANTAIGMNTAQPVSYLAIAISFALIFVGVILIGALVTFFINMAVQVGVLSIGNRLLGAVFGFIRGFIINLVLIFLIQLTSLGTQAWWQQSQFVIAYQPAVLWLATAVSPSLESLKTKWGETLQQVNTSIQNMTH